MLQIPERASDASPTTLTSGSLQRNLLIYYAVGASIFLIAVAALRLSPLPEAAQGTTFPSMDKYVQGTFIALPVFFIAAALLTLLHIGHNRVLLIWDALFSSLVLLALSFVLLALQPGRTLIYPFLFLLLLHAALVPRQIWVQACLSVVAICAFLAGRVASLAFLSENQQAYLGVGDGGYWRNLALGALFLGVSAGLLLYIVRSLERGRRALCEERRFGNYIIEDYLGTGGMGKVYRARHISMLRPTALKIMEPKNEDLTRAILRFEREVKLSATLCHPNTITIYDFGRCDDLTYYYAMELLSGLDLQRMIERFGPLTASRSVHILKQVCGSLSEAHRKGIVHRDIKPSNIFLSVSGGVFDFVKVLDFGLAKEIAQDPKGLTSTDAFLGTPSYVAPEMILDREKVDGRTDIYMLGCVAYWMLTGHPPFEGRSNAQVLVEHVNDLPKWPSDRAEQEIPADLERIVMRCLEKEMAERYRDTEELCLALETIEPQIPWNQGQARDWWNRHLPLGDSDLRQAPPAA
ncbi:MAG TPA: serine/threonine-protein kinase [bacterium]|nr:serine/threonine-protein kinase [bacterium]